MKTFVLLFLSLVLYSAKAQEHPYLKDSLAICLGIDTSEVEIFRWYSYSYDSLLVHLMIGAEHFDNKVGVWYTYKKNMMDAENPDTVFRIENKSVFDEEGTLIAYSHYSSPGIYTRTVYLENENYIRQYFSGDILRIEEHVMFGRGQYKYYYHPNGNVSAEGYEALKRRHRGCLGLWPSYEPQGTWKYYHEDGSLKSQEDR